MIADWNNIIKISNHFFVISKRYRKIFLIFFIFSSFNLPGTLSNTNKNDFSAYEINYWQCKIGGISSIPSKEEIKNKIKECENSLKEEKNIVREIYTRNLIAEYFGYYQSNNKLSTKNFNTKRIELYKDYLNLFDEVKQEDIDEYGKIQLFSWIPKTSRDELSILKQETLSKIATLYYELNQFEKSKKYLLDSNKLFIKGNTKSEDIFILNNGYLANIYYSFGDVDSALKSLDGNIVLNKCNRKKNCIVDKILLSNIYLDMVQYQESYDVLESITLDDYYYDFYNKEARLCNLLSIVEKNKISLKNNGIEVNANLENQSFVDNCSELFKDDYYTKALLLINNEGNFVKGINFLKKAKESRLETLQDGNFREIADIDIYIGATYFFIAAENEKNNKSFEKEAKLAKNFFDLGFDYYDSNNLSFPRYFNWLRFAYSILLITESDNLKEIYKGINYLDKAFKYEIIFQQTTSPKLTIDQRLKVNKNNLIFKQPFDAVFSLIEFLKEKNIDNSFVKELAMQARINFQGLMEDIEKKQNILSNANPENKKMFNKIKSLEAKLSKINEQDKEFKNLNKQKQILEKRLYKSLPYMKPKIINPKEIAKLMPRDSVLIEFQEYEPLLNLRFEEKEYLALILFPNNKIVSVNLGKAKEINRTINSLNKNIVEGNEIIYKKSILEIYNKFFKPLEKHLENSKNVFISLDSTLNLVPFNLLTVGETETYLSDVYELNLIANSRELFRILKENKIKNNNQPVVFSNPDFYLDTKNLGEVQDGDKYFLRIGNNCKNWNYLDGTIEEGNQIKSLINAKLFTGKEATVNNLKNLNSPPKILHMATHGYFCEGENFSKHPLIKNGIVLAGANSDNNENNDDGYLTSLEAAKLNLNNTELVVLSACNTALGNIQAGNGVLGLRRALSVAGAQSTILSLWAVDDEATRAFMTSFYQKLKDGNNRRSALINTQKEFKNGLIQSDDPYIDWTDEFYWGAFQLSGDWRRVDFD